MDQKTIDIFKPALKPKAGYAGGKGKAEVKALVGDIEITKLSSNENILGSSPLAAQAIKDHVMALSEYPERTDAKLRDALALFYKNEMSADQFVTDNSGVAVINMIQRAFLNPGNEVIISNPAFKPYHAFARKLGANIVDVPLLGDNYDLDVAGIINAINDETRLIFATSPNNPTGTHIPKAQLDDLVDQLPDHVVLVYDEVYYQFADAPDYVRGYEYVNQGKQVIAVNSFSKAYGLAGMRIGYAYSTEQISRYIDQVRIPFMINTLAMEGAIAALKDEAFIQRSVELIHEEKAFLYSALDEIGMKYWKTQANFITIKPEMEEKAFEREMLKFGIMVRPVSNFGAPGCIRVTIGDRAANEKYIKALKQIVRV